MVLVIKESLEQVTCEFTFMSHNRDMNECTTVQANFAAGISYKIEETCKQLPPTAPLCNFAGSHCTIPRTHK